MEELRNTSEVDVEKDVEKDASLDGDDTKSKAELDIVSDAITILQGRPDVSKVLEAEVAAATGPMSVDGTYRVLSFLLLHELTRFPLHSCWTSRASSHHSESIDGRLCRTI